MSVPRVFGLPHLTEDSVAAFADGVLSAAAADRARRHCAECTECNEAVRGQREAAMMLRTAGSPSLPAGLLDRLAGLPMSAPLPPPRGGLPTTLGVDGIPVFVAHSAKHKRDGQERDSQEGVGQERDGQERVGQERVSQQESIATVAARQTAAAQHAAEQAAAQHAAAQQASQRSGHRRVLLPVSILASAAAMVAAGTIGGNPSTFPTNAEHPTSATFASNLVSNSSAAGVPAPRVIDAPFFGPARFETARSQPQPYLRSVPIANRVNRAP